MKINIYKDYWLTSDELNVMVSKPVGTDKEGKTVFKNLTFHRNITDALKSIADKEIKMSDATDFKTLKKDIDALTKVFSDIAKSLKEEDVK